MEQFAQVGRVSVHLIARSEVLSAKPSNALFCACRAWDERAEAGYMKRIEDEFHAIVAPIVDGKVEAIASEQKPAVDRMYALWYMRARYRDLEEQEFQLHGIAGYTLTKEQEENLEKNGYMFARKGGTMPGPAAQRRAAANAHRRLCPAAGRGCDEMGRHLRAIGRVHRARRAIAHDHSIVAAPRACRLCPRRRDRRTKLG